MANCIIYYCDFRSHLTEPWTGRRKESLSLEGQCTRVDEQTGESIVTRRLADHTITLKRDVCIYSLLHVIAC